MAAGPVARSRAQIHLRLCFIVSREFGISKNRKFLAQKRACRFEVKQAGTGPSRRHIQGSKIAKRLPSVKYSFTVVETRKFFENFFFEKITY